MGVDSRWLHVVASALVGAFGTALVHEKTGREVSTGGWIGLVVGALLGLYGLASLWVWLLYRQPGLPVRVMTNSSPAKPRLLFLASDCAKSTCLG